MKKLNDVTLERIAELICGSGSGYETPGIYQSADELYHFFGRAGVEPPSFSGTRKGWALDILRTLNDERLGDVVSAGIQKVIMQLLNPEEYKGYFEEQSVLEAVAGHLNFILLKNEKIGIRWNEREAKFNLKKLTNQQLGKLKTSVLLKIYAKRQPVGENTKFIELFCGLRLHSKIREVSEQLFKDGHYSQAVFEAFKAVNNMVKEKAKIKDRDGKNLMTHVFRKESPVLKLNKLETQSDLDEQEGFMFLFMGAMVGIRNPKAHEQFEDLDAYRALKYLSFASILAERVDESCL